MNRGRAGRRAAAGVVLLALVGTACGDAPSPAVGSDELEVLRVEGLAYLEEERNRDAADRFRRLGGLLPDDPLGPANLAVAELRAGDLDAAAAAAAEAVERAPRDPDVRVIAAVVAVEGGRPAEADAHLRAALAADSLHVPALWGVYELTGESAPLEALLRRRPGNLPARLAAAEARAGAGDGDAAVAHLERVEELIPPEAADVRAALEAARSTAALREIRILHNLLRPDPTYRRGLTVLTGEPGARAVPRRRFLAGAAPARVAAEEPLPIRFVPAGSVGAWTAGVATDLNADGRLDLVVEGDRGTRCYTGTAGTATSLGCGPGGASGVAPVAVADVDGDARPDLVLAGSGGLGLRLGSDDGFGELTRVGSDRFDVSVALAADFDHDGDVDLLAGGPGPTRLYRQTAPLRFEAVGPAAGVAGVRALRAASFGDLDMDGDLDVVGSTDDGLVVLRNERQGRYSVESRVADGESAVGTPVIADLDGDGWFDVVFGTAADVGLLRGGPDGLAPIAWRSGSAPPSPGGRPPAVLVEDFDLDGRSDVLVAPRGEPVVLYRGAGDGRLIPSPAGETIASGPVVPFDLDADGDLDLAAAGEGGLLLRNEGGERNQSLDVSLLALAGGNGKVNRLGIGSRLDVWSGARRQARVVRRDVERFGLGAARRADVVRVEWTNGVPQNVFGPSADERLVETQVLKGSCAFLYAWNGEAVEFVTDFMWKSALGMPLGIMAGELAHAPPEPSLEYVRIGPGQLRARDGFYELRITEELWEVAYLDRLELLAVDHPPGVSLFVNEAFGRPTVPNDEIHVVSERLPVEAAIDHRGRDVRGLLAERDFRFVGGFDRTGVQGVTRPHDLVLRLEEAAGRSARLFLAGWVFPTDASINVRIGQAGSPVVVRPRLDVPDGRGGWRPIEASIDFPSGKNKTVVVELPDGVPPRDPRLRIRTTMEVYWDAAFYAVDVPGFTPEPVRLRPSDARLRERGFSAPYRRGGRYGPHWFDYTRVSAASPWRPLPGAYTRTGDVTGLLAAADDRYVVFGPGDEVSVRFPAPGSPPPGWHRTFFLYSDGFLKDADLNTNGGDRTGPFPVHGQTTYPPRETEGPDSSFVTDWLTRHRPSAGPPSRPVPPHSR